MEAMPSHWTGHPPVPEVTGPHPRGTSQLASVSDAIARITEMPVRSMSCSALPDNSKNLKHQMWAPWIPTRSWMSLSPSRHRRRSFQADEHIDPIPKPSSVWRPANLDKERSTISSSKRLASQSAHRRSVDSETSVRSTTSSRKTVSPA